MAQANLDVFVNCPFDEDYREFFYAIVFTIIRCGFRARCGLEADNGADNRLDKICRIISECGLGVHDVSRTETNGDPPLPRFNMPLELGLFLGAKRFGGKRHLTKSCIIFDRHEYRYRQFISDIAGQDVHEHSADIKVLITKLSAWLRLQEPALVIAGGAVLHQEFTEFTTQLPKIFAARKLAENEVTFNDYAVIVSLYLNEAAA
ncbi:MULTISPECIES: hypothetical protein [unclassified Ensifer]|uniref:hypothetical protein n=1 Tax=unclassified Ensifer TaxID=2633371 RepID=UPI00070C0D36|nr:MULTISPECIES: hypothetical protein [unclassified Ensifer]KQW47218.1 hypothetical protein ASD02_34505 [Ensifer sp. Root1252]KRC68770.1 hypothetical protein ASE32_35335 [Ensifer sp. Root231]KRC93936.1 hypothetical protein ASE47_35000 [Ensifer sp. Root258]